MNDNFFLYRDIKNFSFEMMEYIDNIPKRLYYLKDEIVKSFDNSVRLVRYYIVNINDAPRIRNKYLKDLIVELSMIDYYLEALYHNKVLGKNRFNDFCIKLETIRKLAYGVINREKKQCEI